MQKHINLIFEEILYGPQISKFSKRMKQKVFKKNCEEIKTERNTPGVYVDVEMVKSGEITRITIKCKVEYKKFTNLL